MLNLANESNENCPPNLHYRGYYYDTETGFYYLQSRYYDPVTHRFINADSAPSTGQGIIGTNMFAYCNNTPVNLYDSRGKKPVEILDTDGDGEDDCYVYEYFYIATFDADIGQGNDSITITTGFYGYICFFVGKREADFDNGVSPPPKYSNSILIGDLRHGKTDNPNLQVYESCCITSTEQMEAIIDVMMKYDREIKSENAWGRTKKSLLHEWKIHNMGYEKFEYGGARSTDFDFKEEGWGYINYALKYLKTKL